MKNIKIEIKWSIIFTIMMLCWMFMEKVSGLHDQYIHLHPIVTNFVAIPAILIYVLAMRDKKNNYYNGRMTYLQGLLCGITISLLLTLLSPLMQYVTSVYITPDYFRNAIDYAVKTGYMTAEKASDYFNLKNYIIQATIGTPCMGIVTTAIVALFLKSKQQKGMGTHPTSIPNQ